MTDEELLRVSAANPHLRFELVEGELIGMAPTGDRTSRLEIAYLDAVLQWAKKNAALVFGSSAGFRLPNENVRSPDVGVILPGHPAYGETHDGFTPGAPDFVIEIRSKSDSFEALDEKMGEWIAQGARLGWLIDPARRKAFVYQGGHLVREVVYTDALDGGDILPGLVVVPAQLDPSRE